MSTPRTIRMTRVRRAAAISAAAVAVVLGLTACDSASAGDSSGYGAGRQPGTARIVNVANERADEDGNARNGRERGDRESGATGRPERRGPGRPGRRPGTTGPEEDPGPRKPPARSRRRGGRRRAEARRTRSRGEQRAGCPRPRLRAQRPRPHTGFQEGDRCVATAFGEVGEGRTNPSLLITESPDDGRGRRDVRDQGRHQNLIRDRFLGAARGRLLPGELVAGRGRACSAATSTPPAGCCRRRRARPSPAQSPGVLRGDRRTTAAAKRPTRSRSGAGRSTSRGDRAVRGRGPATAPTGPR